MMSLHLNQAVSDELPEPGTQLRGEEWQQVWNVLKQQELFFLLHDAFSVWRKMGIKSGLVS